MKKLAVLLLGITPTLAFAYVDPGTGAYMVQALIALVAAGAAYVRNPLKALKSLWDKIMRRGDK